MSIFKHENDLKYALLAAITLSLIVISTARAEDGKSFPKMVAENNDKQHRD